MKKIAVITGATGGIGEEFVKQILCYDLDEVWTVARSENKLNELREKYNEKIIPVSADLSDISGIQKISNLLSEQSPQVKFLINDAGLAKMAPCKDFSQDEIIRTIDVNCKAPVLLCNIVPYMKQGGKSCDNSTQGRREKA